MILINGERKIVILTFIRWRKFKYECPIIHILLIYERLVKAVLQLKGAGVKK